MISKRRNSIMVKMIVFYTIPFILLSVLLVWNSTHTTRNIQDSFITNMSHAFDQSYRDIEGRIQVASDLTSMVSRNNKMLEFINDPYLGDQSEFLKEYLDTVTPIIKYATAFSESDDYSIRVYMGNDAIPESWPYFFHLSNYSSHPKLQQFVQKDSETRLWLLPDDRELGPASLHDERRKYTLLTKLYSPARGMLGLAVVTLAEDSLFSIEEEPANLSNAQFLYAGGHIGLSTAELDEAEEAAILQQHIGDKRAYFIQGEYLYLHRNLDSIGQSLVYKVSLEQLNASVRKNVWNQILLIVFSILLLMITCYFMFKMIFLRLNKIVSVMRQVITGNNSIRIPDNRPDELGQLAHDFNDLIERNNELIHRVVMKERLRKEAQIKALQYQINPHFIYNTLDIFRMQLIKARIFDTADRLADFGQILRYNLSDNTLHTTLNEEIGLIRKYVSLQSLSSSKEIRLDIEVQESLKTFPVIKFLLQPIVENSIKYGQTARRELLHIQVRAYAIQQQVIIDITDNGWGMEEEQIAGLNEQFRAPLHYEDPAAEPPRRSIGLHNINSRLRLYYGDAYPITMEGKSNDYTKVQIRIPYE
ncbi:histidine kinase [Paenibacillus sp. FSL R7-0210]|uniref:sensor histidine kinase n=1 Tax=Paenibacillus sp. FSL R7-0210 TaxID=2921676 RepID=UPI0030F547D6